MRSNLSSLSSMAGRLRSRRADWSFWTMSVVEQNRTRRPVSMRAWPMANCVRLAGPALAEQQQVAAVLDPVVTGGEGQEVRFADAGGGVEIEGGEGLACG